jgi:hypothetical protein
MFDLPVATLMRQDAEMTRFRQWYAGNQRLKDKAQRYNPETSNFLKHSQFQPLCGFPIFAELFVLGLLLSSKFHWHCQTLHPTSLAFFALWQLL